MPMGAMRMVEELRNAGRQADYVPFHFLEERLKRLLAEVSLGKSRAKGQKQSESTLCSWLASIRIRCRVG